MKMKRQSLRFDESGALKMVSDETANLKDKEVLIRVRYAPVTKWDKQCLSMKKEEYNKECGTELGQEGSGTIEALGSGLDQSFKGRKVAFCHGGWSQFIVKNFDELLIFDDSVDLKMAATSVVNPMTALSIKYMLLDKGAKSFVFLGANSTLGRIFMRLAQLKGLEPIVIVQNEQEASLLKKDLGLKDVFYFGAANFKQDL